MARPEGLRGDLRWDEPLARHTTWRVGGPARCLYRPADADDLALFLAQLDPHEPVLWLGLGSNLLVADTGFAGTVIQTQTGLTRLERRDEQGLLVECGVSCAKFARFAARCNLIGCEFLAGIPGTMGGALAMNAGAWGGETWPFVVAVQTIDRRGQRHQRLPDEYRVGYREVVGPPREWFLAAELRLPTGDGAAAMARIRALLDRRAATQPTGQPSCGSVFRNPQGDHAARLIDQAGLKGYRVGDAQVSEKHANFIINTGRARAADILELMTYVQTRVEEVTGVRLVPEVKQITGDHS
ncbi:UDP-N-acetylenolpyruvoylglucosamine reductase [Thiocapsa imhoffii]|uniref:UDP-N-acetylenolpyruvoylglucosamine reductase n=1 Tax=Thiocapsa imhoffii TaxID=382777 RepID=A0A9X1B723_9GAMM|nr:UDP-N-acetylmuramate dehydrogenase [Thiocapsa imhoffii]MBK1643369.1 UDP-N-acetylenolpyruvoylglucosamine reductase [Thiocapsa imhoffii]